MVYASVSVQHFLKCFFDVTCIYIYILYSSWLCWQVPKAEPMDVKD